MLQLGLYCIYSEPIVARTDEIVALMTDVRWPWQGQLMHIGNIPGGPRAPQVKGKIPIAKLRDAIRGALDAPSATNVRIACSKQQALDHAWMRVQTGREDIFRYKIPFELMAMTRAENVPAGKSIASWIELAHDFVRTVRGVHGVIVVTRNDWHLSDELWLGQSAIDGKPTHEHGPEIQRVSRNRRELGTKWVRPAQWGDYYSAAAMAAIGGRAAIERAVAPAVIREVGDLTYVQLSERVEDALAPATEAKRRALGELIAPIVVPVRPTD
jgi:hypothetical protein